LSVSDYTTKKNILVKEAKSLVLELDALKKEQKTLLDIDFSEYEQLASDIATCNDKIQDLKNKIKVNNINIENLLVPMPSDNKCKHCRQELSPEHKKTCQENIDKELLLNKKENSEIENLILKSKEELLEKDKKLNLLNLYKKKINDINLKISLHNKEIASKKLVHDEYLELLNKYSKNLELTNLELNDILNKKNKLPLLKIKELKENIIVLKEKQAVVKKDLLSLNNDLNSLNIKLGMLEYSLIEINKNCDLHKEYTAKLQELTKQIRLYPKIIQAFSSSGIPNIIIQNVLDDLQIESNNLLNNLRPGLQLAFAVEKTKADGSESDTLDINYTLNGKERYYEQLSGAMKLAVSFSLKLGLSFVLQKLIGVNVRFFLLDEVDQSLDRATIDAFADMIKMFQNNFKFIISS
jgi:DNA repair exonuclease SbcCD ATPase subunit